MARSSADKRARRRRRRLSGLAVVAGMAGVVAAVRGRALGKDQRAFEARYGRLAG